MKLPLKNEVASPVAELISYCPATDLAVAKIHGEIVQAIGYGAMKVKIDEANGQGDADDVRRRS